MSVKSDILLKMKNVPTSTNVKIKLVIPMQFSLIPLVVFYVSVKMGSEVMALVVMISMNVKVVCTTAIWLQNVATSLVVLHANVMKDGKVIVLHVKILQKPRGHYLNVRTTRLNLKLMAFLNVFVIQDMS